MASQILTTVIIILVIATSTAQSLSREEADEYIRSFMSRTGSSSTTSTETEIAATDSTTDAPMTVVGGTVEVVEAVKVREMVEVVEGALRLFRFVDEFQYQYFVPVLRFPSV